MKYTELTEQVLNKEYKTINFAIYNHIDDDGWLKELSAHNGVDYGIDDLEYTLLTISDEDKSGIKNNLSPVIQKYKLFKRYVEHELQDFHNIGVFIMNEYGCVVVVKPIGHSVDCLKI